MEWSPAAASLLRSLGALDPDLGEAEAWAAFLHRQRQQLLLCHLRVVLRFLRDLPHTIRQHTRRRCDCRRPAVLAVQHALSWSTFVARSALPITRRSPPRSVFVATLIAQLDVSTAVDDCTDQTDMSRSAWRQKSDGSAERQGDPSAQGHLPTVVASLS